MSRVVGIVCEGPTDYEVISCVVDTVTKERNEYLYLQPEESLMGQFGNGWKGVWKWCESHSSIIHDYMNKVTPHIDCLIIHMDGDVSRKEKEVHCMCTSTICENAGKLHPLHCTICKEGNCPVVLPCNNHDSGNYASHLRHLIKSWLCITDLPQKIILTIPCDSIDTWIVVSYEDLIENCELYKDPWNAIIAHSANYHSIRIPGGKKRVYVYKQLVEKLVENWKHVASCCLQASIFESDIKTFYQTVDKNIL